MSQKHLPLKASDPHGLGSPEITDSAGGVVADYIHADLTWDEAEALFAYMVKATNAHEILLKALHEAENLLAEGRPGKAYAVIFETIQQVEGANDED